MKSMYDFQNYPFDIEMLMYIGGVLFVPCVQ